jgi:hypothetical protein
VTLNDIPPTIVFRSIRGALVDNLGYPIRQRAIDHVGVAGNPTDVGGAPVDVGVRLKIKNGMVGICGLC